jgi:uncharacterized protein YqeY
MASLSERLSADLKDAMRAGDTTRRDEIRTLLALLKAELQAKLTRTLAEQQFIVQENEATLTPEQEAAIGRVRSTTALTEDDEQSVLLTRVKQHRQSIEAFRKGNRSDLVQMEEAQLAQDEPYLPKQLSEDEIASEIDAAIAETGAQGRKDMGKVMGLLNVRLRGKADTRAVAARVQARLSG